MLRSPYAEKALEQNFRVGDSGRWKVDLGKDKNSIATSAAERAASDPPQIFIDSKRDKSGKVIYFAGDIETDLILRATYRRLLKQYRVHLPNREDIVNGIIEATSEACPYRVTKCDVKSFYESLDAEPIVRKFLEDTRTDPNLKAVLRQTYIAASIARSVVPRGLAISTVIAEIALRDFDRVIRKTHGIHRYFRYADDIIIFSLPDVEILSIVEKELNAIGLQLNEKTETSVVRSIAKWKEPKLPPVAKYSYLGYDFVADEKVSSDSSREFNISISATKLLKRKTRIFLSLHAFLKDGDARLLIDRLNYISTNQSVYKTRHSHGARKQKIRTGIHYNYARCGHYPASKNGRIRSKHNAHELIAIDVVLRNILWGSQSEFAKAISSLPSHIQDDLRRISFAQGFKKRLMKRFTRQRMAEICKVWGHE
ncbi:antiviral reverse transcriptase Drt3a [Saliniramus fredricksonii]|uniref:Reverse transcriptase (RNA-dependent DNA polymerase) n=1 Tax=Saliniramus fredricksonii TaxID=1653334 RepID=A0ABY0K5V5_9HYPH|nr:antiviral reverse transcriptase Drt3a [Saliniramus fredricksonii]SCC79258.1 Reverse transcriptase (RNA-dependent DNA polymerase) [Saliniramus fredricksonii]